MKLTLNAAAPQGEQWQRKNRQANTYPPPDDGREWILIDEAAKLFGIKPHSMYLKAHRLDFTRTARRGIKTWLLKSEVISYLDFLKMRERWYKRHRPQGWEPMQGSYEGETDERMQRIFWTTKQAAAFMGVSVAVIQNWAKSGRIPVFYNHKMGKGGRNWYSPTSLRNLKEDEDYLKRKAIHQKGNATLRTGSIGREVYKQRHKPRVYRKPIPDGWITLRQAAELLDISLPAVEAIRKRGGVVSEHFTGKWDAKNRPWFILQSSLKEYIQTEEYRRRHQKGVAWTQKRAGIHHSDSAPVAFTQRYESHPADEQATLGCQHDILPKVKEERMSIVHSPDLW